LLNSACSPTSTKGYLFIGNRGNIYRTDGTNVSHFKKVSDYVTDAHEPYFTWKDAIPWRNQLYFSFNVTKNDQTTSTTGGGVWGIDLSTGALRNTNQLSYGTYGGSATILIPNILATYPAGNGLYIGWSNSSTYGVDVSATTYYTNYAAYFISPMFIAGTHKNKGDTQEAEITLEQPLASGEGVRISYRKNRSAAWSTPVTFDYATYGALQTANLPLVANELVTIQAKVEATGGATTPRLREVRIR
jgi:hypothetical protein